LNENIPSLLDVLFKLQCIAAECGVIRLMQPERKMSILINLEHTVEEVNSILAALAERPFKEVADLIVKIQAKGQEALASAQVSEPIVAAPVESDAPASDQEPTS
jgi:hypothetical protein